MPQFDWKILETSFVDKNVEFVKYYVKATENDLFVETEGYAEFKLPPEVIYETLTEEELTRYLKRFYIQNETNTIELRLTEQLANLAKNRTNLPPWHVPTFKLDI